jgi:hypothetical protein
MVYLNVMLQKIKDHILPHRGNNFSPRLFAAESIIAIVALLVVSQAGFIIHNIVLRHSDYMSAVLPGVLTVMTNSDRESLGIPPLKTNALLTKAAQLKADDMAAKGYFAHQDPQGKSPWHWFEQVGYEYSYAGENLAVDFSESGAVENAWMNSPLHRANIIKSNFTNVGIGVARGMYQGRETVFVVQFFATPMPTVTTIATEPLTDLKPELESVATPTPTKIATQAAATLKSEYIEPIQDLAISTYDTYDTDTYIYTDTDIYNTDADAQVLGVQTQAVEPVVESAQQDTYDKMMDSVAEGTSIINTKVERASVAPSLWYMPLLIALFAIMLTVLSIAMFVHVGNRRVEGVAIAVVLLMGLAGLIYVNFNAKSLGVTLPTDAQYASTIKSINY